MHKLPLVLVAVAALTSSLPAAAGRGRQERQERQERQAERQERREERREQGDAPADASADGKHDGKHKGKDAGVNRQQRRQASKIAGGVRSGQLTKAEVDALTAREASLRTLEADMKSDGALTKAERDRLHEELRALGQAIHDDKHDDDKTAPLQPRTPDDRAGGKACAGKARRLGEVRRALNGSELSEQQRASLEQEHAQLVDELYDAAAGDDAK